MIWIFLTVIIGLISWLLIFYNLSFKYWEKKNVPVLRKPRFPHGTASHLLPPLTHLGITTKNVYLQARSREFKHVGGYAFYIPIYNAIDPDYIKNILQVDWEYFMERGMYLNEKNDPLSGNLFNIGGKKWRYIRTKLSPAFTSGKLKLITKDILQCADQMLDGIKTMCESQEGINIRDLAERYTIDVIGCCAFDLECNSFKNPDAIFPKQGRKIFHFTILRTLKTVFALSFPNIARKLGIALFDTETTNFFSNMVEEIIQHRKANKSTKQDFLQLLFELGDQENKNSSQKRDKGFSILELTAQVFIFFAAGFETSSLTLAYCLYELSLNQEIQNKAREEMNRVLIEHDGKIEYDSVMDMKYLIQVVKETLRKYPPVPFLSRECVKDYQIPGTETVLDKGTFVVISVLGLHHDPEYYPEPDKFDPARFSDENKSTRHPFTYLPFGEGPRMCIGLRFGLLQTLIGLVNLLRCYRFSLNENTAVPIEIEPLAFTFIPKSGIFLNAELIN